MTEYRRINAGEDNDVYEALSVLDKACVGADGWSAESFRSECAKENGIVLAAFEDGVPAGLLSGYTAVGEADITSVAVAPAYRRMGIARRLVADFEALLPEDTENIYLEVRESNEGAIALYRNCGFEKLSVRRRFYSAPEEDALVMTKTIRKG
ncbi:MAG TPA: ribosomal-protein-alanine N-acetyltransferase [Ruminococcus sp.]|nr:ribosomal-protein-alanine N-acetyltransferase [Ruminococcus sp.]